MLVKNDFVNKDSVVYVKESDSLQTVLDKIADSGYRCIPVLDDSGTTYVGNVYKVDLLKYELEQDLKGPVTPLIKDQDIGHVKEDDAFFKVFKTIKQLPFLAVVGEEKEFLGILTNGNVIQVLESAWGVDRGSYSLTIGTIEYAGALQKILGIINKYCSVEGVISLNNDLKFVRRVCIVLPIDVKEETANKIIEELDSYNFTVIHTEKLN